jgi:hypothetical protein
MTTNSASENLKKSILTREIDPSQGQTLDQIEASTGGVDDALLKDDRLYIETLNAGGTKQERITSIDDISNYTIGKIDGAEKVTNSLPTDLVYMRRDNSGTLETKGIDINTLSNDISNYTIDKINTNLDATEVVTNVLGEDLLSVRRDNNGTLETKSLTSDTFVDYVASKIDISLEDPEIVTEIFADDLVHIYRDNNGVMETKAVTIETLSNYSNAPVTELVYNFDTTGSNPKMLDCSLIASEYNTVNIIINNAYTVSVRNLALSNVRTIYVERNNIINTNFNSSAATVLIRADYDNDMEKIEVIFYDKIEQSGYIFSVPSYNEKYLYIKYNDDLTQRITKIATSAPKSMLSYNEISDYFYKTNPYIKLDEAPQNTGWFIGAPSGSLSSMEACIAYKAAPFTILARESINNVDITRYLLSPSSLGRYTLDQIKNYRDNFEISWTENPTGTNDVYSISIYGQTYTVSFDSKEQAIGALVMGVDPSDYNIITQIFVQTEEDPSVSTGYTPPAL